MLLAFCALLFVHNCSKAAEVYVHTVSEHYTMDKAEYNEENWGVSYVQDEHNFGVALNSYDELGGYYARTFYTTSFSGVDFGLGAGFALGYDRVPILPLVAATVDIGRVRMYVAPTVVNLAVRVW